MILSRAIFIGRKRISFLALLLFIALSSYASEYRIAVVIDAESSVPYVENFESYLEFSSRVVMNDSLSDAAKKRDEELLEIDYEKAVARAYREERDVSSVRRESLASSTYEGEIVNLELSDEDISAVRDSVVVTEDEGEGEFECPICHEILPAGTAVCPKCGAEFEFE